MIENLIKNVYQLKDLTCKAFDKKKEDNMKAKKLNKLVLNKETIANLNNRQMGTLFGGAEGGTNNCTVWITFDPCENPCLTEITCPTDPIICTTDDC